MTRTLDTPVDGLTLREAVPGDEAQIIAFIRGLAEYERLAHEMVATEDDIATWTFGPDKVIDVVLADYRGQPAGFALYFQSFSTFLGKPGIYLEDLFVKPELRGKGIGTALLVYLAKITTERGFGRLEWSVLDWNTPSIEFYRSLGAVGMDEWTVNRMTGDVLDALAQRMTFTARS